MTAPFYLTADTEASVGNKLDLGLNGLESYLKSNNAKEEVGKWWKNSLIYDIKPLRKLFSYFEKVFYETTDKPEVVLHAGDFIGKTVQAEALIQAHALQKKLLENDLTPELKDYKAKYESLDDKLRLANIYADILFDEKLVNSPVSGAYTKIFDKLEQIAEENNVEIGFVLGNNDLSYKLFAERFKNYDKLHFIDGKVKNIKGLKVAGFGGSPEISNYLGSIGDVASDTGFNKGLYDKLKGKVDVLLTHKSYSKVDVKPKKGSLPKNVMTNEVFDAFDERITSLVKKLKPSYVLGGHWHEGVIFDYNNAQYLNPGSRGLLMVNGEPEQVVKSSSVYTKDMKAYLNKLSKVDEGLKPLISFETKEEREKVLSALLSAPNMPPKLKKDIEDNKDLLISDKDLFNKFISQFIK